jgi:alkyldihydroxyacetonephosphate synthase
MLAVAVTVLCAQFVFKSWEAGMAFMRESYLAGCTPAACRLVDNDQFRFGHALKPEKKGLKNTIASSIQKLAVTKIYGMDPLTMVASTMKYEGSDIEVSQQKSQVTSIAKKHGGVSGGAEGGRTGYNVTMAIAYIGDFLAQHNVIGETFETCSPWDKVSEVIAAAKQEATDQHKLLGLPGQSFISSRVTQQYHSGVCIYFTYGYYHGGMDGATHAFEKIYFHVRATLPDPAPAAVTNICGRSLVRSVYRSIC